MQNKNDLSHALSSGRLHALDNLRALLALLGIPFHACLLLLVVTGHRLMTNFDLYLLVSQVQPFNAALFLFVFFFHVFRMPAFFLLAGFFAHFIYQRSTVRKLLTNRFIRIAVPLLFIIIWFYPIYLNSVLLNAVHQSFLNHQNVWPVFLSQIKHDWLQGKTWSSMDNTRDAWFLDYLLWCYVMTLLLLFVKKLHPLTQVKRLTNHYVTHCLFTRARYILIPIMLTALMMTAHPSVWVVAYDTHLKPNLTLLACYSIWYFLGWWLWENHRDFSAFMKNPGWQLLAAIATYLIYLSILLHFANGNSVLMHIVGLFFYMLTMVLSVFAVIGLAWRYLNAPSFLRHISASAYWIYLVQMPILLVSIPIIALLHWSFLQQLIANILLCVLLCLSSYYFLVRPTWLHRILGG